MTKRPIKMLPIWIAVSSVIILAGILLFALLGFNHSAERGNNKTFEVEYDVVVDTAENGIESLKDACETAFKASGISYGDYQQAAKIDANTGSETVGGKLIYTFSVGVSDEALAKAKAAVESFANETFEDAQVYADYHVSYNTVFTDAAWRAAIAVAVGLVVALIYVGIRFGVGAALTGLTLTVHDVLVALSLLAILRIPVYTFAPIVVGAVAAFASLFMWVLQCMKMRENFKSAEYGAYSAEEAVEASSKTAEKAIYIAAGALGIVLVIFTVALAIAGSQLGAILLPLVCLFPVGVSVYSSLLFGPALHVPVKTAFDKFNSKHKRRFGKAKADKKKEEKEN